MSKLKKFLLIVLPALGCSACIGQFATIEKLDSFKRQLNLAKEDTSRVLMMSYLSLHYGIWNRDSAEVYGMKALALAKQINYPRGEARALIGLARNAGIQGDLPQSLEYTFRALRIAEENQYLPEKAMCYTDGGYNLGKLEGNPSAIAYFQQADSIYKSFRVHTGMDYWEVYNAMQIAALSFWNDPSDSTLIPMQGLLNANMGSDYWRPVFMRHIASMQFRLGKAQNALPYMRQVAEAMKRDENYFQLAAAYMEMSTFFKTLHQEDSGIYYAQKSLAEAQYIGMKYAILDASQQLAQLYESTDIKKALYYRKVYDSTNAELYGEAKVRSLQKIVSEEQQQQRNIEATRIAYQNRLKQYGLLAGLGVFLLIAFLLYRNNRQQHKANQKLQEQKEEIQSTLIQLKSTQSQLIQSEKMASLGELTAGIAHEIQNPLNFINNFSEVNEELLIEMKDEMNKGNIDDANAIADNVIGNEEKINYHGKRADAIVKSMMQHSRNSSNIQEPTDINALADEYLRLSYHGLRAKDKEFNATMQTDFDTSIGNINIVPQDIGRVLLNLYNNAFYAVSEKKKSADATYEPTVSVSTKRIGDNVEIIVKDNGNGIPQKVVDKIFQPFFTTKPTGQGTGLGLSLSYDIVKAHSGEISVNTKEGEFTAFVILLATSF
jgi:two-component system, NtrC family, sensor kinase